MDDYDPVVVIEREEQPVGFRTVNGFARDTPWLHGFLQAWAVYGILLFVPLVLLAGLMARRAGPPRRVAGVLGIPAAAGIALLINQPIVHAVHERRPFVALPHVLTLVHHAPDPGFPSDHATASGAVAAGLFAADRRLGYAGIVVAVLISFSRVYVGVHYPLDVVAGLILGVIVALAIRPIAIRLLRRPIAAISRTPFAVLVTCAQAATASTRFPEMSDSDHRNVPERIRSSDITGSRH